MATDYERRPITVAEYQRLAEMGFFADDERVELLDGELIVMPPLGFEHKYSQSTLNEMLVLRFAGRALVQPVGSIVVDRISQPEPDLVLLHGPRERYRTRHATAADAFLVVEIALTSLRFDRIRKARVYGRNGIPEYWIVNLVDKWIEVNRDPDAEGYRSTTIVAPGEAVAPLAFPDEAFAAADFLP